MKSVRHTAFPPVPDPMAPMKSAMMVSAPMHMPPNAAAVGMYRFSSFFSACVVSRCPCATSWRALARDHAESPCLLLPKRDEVAKPSPLAAAWLQCLRTHLATAV